MRTIPLFKKYLKLSVISLFLFYTSTLWAQANPPLHDPPYNPNWWARFPQDNVPRWEILPHTAEYGEVILSKRTELGIFSNFAATPFTLDGKVFASMEGFWQSLKYPEGPKDERSRRKDVDWKFTRSQVAAMTGFDAKHAGDLGTENMKKLSINWVTYKGKKYVYKEPGESEFYFLILRAMKAKWEQNSQVAELLKKTEGLILRPDHDTQPQELKAWQYHQIWMQFRDAGEASRF